MKSDSEGNYFIIYSDNIDTQVFKFAAQDIALKKLTKKVCHANDLPELEASKYIKTYKDEYSSSLKALIVTAALQVQVLDLETLKLTIVADLKNIVDTQLAVQGGQFNKYDTIFNFALFNESSGLLAINFVHSEMMFVFRVSTIESSCLYWTLPKSTSESS